MNINLLRVGMYIYSTNSYLQLTGPTGRIEILDFWKHDGHDVFQLESFVHDNPPPL